MSLKKATRPGLKLNQFNPLLGATAIGGPHVEERRHGKLVLGSGCVGVSGDGVEFAANVARRRANAFAVCLHFATMALEVVAKL